MRHWLFHPIAFYPLAALLAALVIGLSLKPQAWPRPPAPVAALHEGGWLVFEGARFNSPAPGPDQRMTVPRDFWGRALALRIAENPNQAPPTPGEDGVRLLLTPEDGAALSGRRLTIEVSYNPSPVNAASGLALSARGAGPSPWVGQPAPPQPATLRFDLPAQSSVNAIGLRALSDNDDQAYGLEITRVRIAPRA
ncbi:MAG: hypothetical protein R3C25_14260 [Hyphomonadaceae bacterium]